MSTSPGLWGTRPRRFPTDGVRISRSQISTRTPGACARAPARFRAVVVFPSPARALVTATTFLVGCFHSSTWRSVRYWSASNEVGSMRLTRCSSTASSRHSCWSVSFSLFVMTSRIWVNRCGEGAIGALRSARTRAGGPAPRSPDGGETPSRRTRRPRAPRRRQTSETAVPAGGDRFP